PSDAPNLVGLANLAGYKTFWISNQIALGEFETPITAIAKSSSYTSFPNKSRSYRNTIHDSILFEPFERALKDEAPKKVIFLHLMGNHSKYSNRYPSEFDRFKDKYTSGSLTLNDSQQKSYNSYDNAILYNDWVLNEF